MSTPAEQMNDHLNEELAKLAAPRPQPSTSARSAPGPASARLTPLGMQTRPNGQSYHPRLLDDLEDLAFLRDARAHGEHVLLTGPPGTGKTALCEAAFVSDATARHTGLETIVGTADTEVGDFVGTWVQDPVSKAFEWAPGPLMRSVLHDVPLLVDEIAVISPGVLTVLYPLMDGRGELHIPMNPLLPPLKVGSGWALIGACNPDAPGARLSEALLSRFHHHVEVTTDWDLAADLGVPMGLITLAQNLETRRLLPTPTYDGWIPQLRDALAFAESAARYGEPFAVANLMRKCPPQDRHEFSAALKKTSLKEAKPLALGARVRMVRR
ncbi:MULTISPECIES: AAA family ATPase [unclassified Streptomyces]|uniref:AAA family ATPase n=1 Tax=unclassified Streptomyces TaxID=2593676 RepID=UPI00225A9F3D|nr:AAA family ATPase [Streptomyces sp. NBC_01264]MCX4783905.1 AAA family ATPase [Streptomyces sp. NBC_01264]